MSAYAERSRWPDERLDDLASEVIVLKGAPIRIATITAQLEGMRRDLDNMGDLIRQFGARVDQALSTLEHEQAEHAVEERFNIRSHRGRQHLWGAAQSVAMLITAVVAVIALLIGLNAHP